MTIKRNRGPIRKPKVRSTSKAYWERVLKSWNLGMERGNQLVDSETEELIEKLRELDDRPTETVHRL